MFSLCGGYPSPVTGPASGLGTVARTRVPQTRSKHGYLFQTIRIGIPYPPAKTGYPPPPVQVTPWAVCLLWFHIGRLSCSHFQFSYLDYLQPCNYYVEESQVVLEFFELLLVYLVQ